MRIAIIPCVTFKKYETESEILQYRRFAKTLWNEKQVVTLLFIPSDMTDEALIRDEPGLFHVKLGDWKKFHEAMGQLHPGLESVLGLGLPKVYVDMVLTTRTGVAGYIQRMLWMKRDTFIPVVIQEQMAADFSSQVVRGIDDMDLMARSFSYAMCPSVFSIPLEKKVAMTAAKRYLTPSVFRKLNERSRVMPPGLDFDVVNSVREKVTRKNAKFTVFFGGRFNMLKRAKELIETYDWFYSRGRPIRVVITSPLGSFPKKMRKPEELEVHTGLNTKQFLTLCCKSHVLLASSKLEGFTVGLLEQLATGIVAILPDLDWAAELLRDQWPHYPFKFKTFSEAYGLMNWIYENYEEAQEKVAWVPEWLASQYDERRCSLELFDWMEGICKERWPSGVFGREKGNRNAALVEEHLNLMPKRFYLQDLLNSISDSKENLYRKNEWHMIQRGKFSAWMLYNHLTFHPAVRDLGEWSPYYEKR